MKKQPAKTPTKHEKPAVPKGFPLSWHAGSGQWYARINRKFVYYGKDPEAARRRFLRERDYLLAGEPVPGESSQITVREVANQFLAVKESRANSGQISRRTFAGLLQVATEFVAMFGTKDVNTLKPMDFERFRASLSGGSPVVLKNKLIRLRSLFKFATDNVEGVGQIKFGTGLELPTKRELRRHRARQPKPLLTPEDFRNLWDAANVRLRAWIGLGLFAGLYASDLSQLCHGHIVGEFLDFPRPKTAISRRCWLPQVVRDAIKAATVKGKSDELMFRTATGKQLLTDNPDGSRIDKVANAFSILKRGIGFDRAGAGFKALRHTARTVIDACGDQPAADLFMGHTSGHISEAYRHELSDDRLRTLGEYLQRWAWPETA